MLGSSPAVIATHGFVVFAQILILLYGLDLSATVRYVDNIILMKHGHVGCILHLRSLIL